MTASNCFQAPGRAARQNRKAGGGKSDRSLSSSRRRTSLTVSKTIVCLPSTV